MHAQQVARGLGWFSLGLGVLELALPGRLTRFLGAPEHSTLVRTYGLREVVAGLGLLLTPTPMGMSAWVWGRVAGDVLDLATVGKVSPERPRGRKHTGNTLAMLTAITVADVLCARALTLSTPEPLVKRLMKGGRS
ncbi:hypothetical protein DKM44_00340 [Deinococcus irradiatisoli]|uniref:Uncharacterized protein n=1 Tax=Deinococcus irradiatisoli TaxID=2202254 RepID=A0A2Z3JKR3_9DEIO|nr:hypothetical protein [Deinococcus irradiatisoli]AWN21874.1 hypothetical protein DKM44_00340 [Deinococcus irradiatisoli]